MSLFGRVGTPNSGAPGTTPSLLCVVLLLSRLEAAANRAQWSASTTTAKQHTRPIWLHHARRSTRVRRSLRQHSGDVRTLRRLIRVHPRFFCTGDRWIVRVDSSSFSTLGWWYVRIYPRCFCTGYRRTVWADASGKRTGQRGAFWEYAGGKPTSIWRAIRGHAGGKPAGNGGAVWINASDERTLGRRLVWEHACRCYASGWRTVWECGHCADEHTVTVVSWANYYGAMGCS